MPPLKIWHKLTFAVLAFSLLLAALLYSFVTEKRREAEAVQSARNGATYLVAVRRVIEQLPEYEQQMSEKGEAEQAVKQIEQAFQALEVAEKNYGSEAQTKDQLAILQSKWQAMKGQGPIVAPLERQALLANALNAARNLSIQIGNSSQILLAQDLSTYYTMDLVLLTLPEQQDNLARLWQLAFNVATRHDLTPETHARMLALSGKIREDVTNAENSLRVAVGHDQSVALQTLSLSNRESTSRTLAFLNLVENWLIKGDGAIIEPNEVSQAGRQAFAASLRFWDAAHPALEIQLQQRAAKTEYDLYFWLLAGVGGWLVLLLLGWRIVRGVSQPLNLAARLAGDLARGKLTETKPQKVKGEAGALLRSMQEIAARQREIHKFAEALSIGQLSKTIAPLTPNDIVGHSLQKMSAYFNEQARNIELFASGNLTAMPRPKSERDRLGKASEHLLEYMHRLSQGQREHERTQSSILSLLAEVSEAATGDLTVEAEVKGDPTGAIADAFNLMIGKLRQIIYKVKDTTFLVNQSAVNIQLTTDELAAGSEHQAGQLKGVVLGIRDMSNLIQVVTEHASQSAVVARRALDSSNTGVEAIHQSYASTRRIREQVMESSKRIHRLGERSQEIVTSLEVIKDIAGRTSMLALNASIQAGAAGGSGHGFVVVAEEIEALSERIANVTKQIATLAGALQAETRDVAAVLDTAGHEAHNGAARVSEAAQALNDIGEVANQLTLLIQAIWQASQKQTRGADEIARSMREISRVTNRVLTGSQEAAASVRQLVGQAGELRESVVAFRLPDKSVNVSVDIQSVKLSSENPPGQIPQPPELAPVLVTD
jgi:methyl-accepting chemotaxis protein